MAQHGSGYNDTGNAVQDVNRVLLKYADSDNMNEQLAAKAAISNIFNTQGVSANANGDALGEVTAKELELTEKINEFKRTQDVAVFTRPVNAENVNRYEVGQFEKPLDYDKSKEEFDAKTSQTMVEKHADLLQHKGKIDTQGQAVVDSNKQAMSAMELKADTHVRGNERGVDKIQRPWEVWNNAWGVPQEEVAAAQAERAARLGGIQSANGSQDSGAFIHPVYRGETNDGINLMTDSGERIPVDNTPHNEPQNSAMPVAQQGTQINQAEVKQADIQHAEVNVMPADNQTANLSQTTDLSSVQQEREVSGSLKDTAQTAEVVNHSPVFTAPEYLRQPESSGSVANEPKQDEPKHTPFAENSAENSLSGSLNNAEQSLDKARDTTPPAEEKSFGDKAREVAGEVAESAIKGVLGISEAQAADMPIMHRQPENQQADNKPFNPLDFDPKQDAWSRTVRLLWIH